MNLSKCHLEATAHWQSVAPSSADIQSIRARVCVEILGGKTAAGSLTPKDAGKLLRGLNDRGLSRKSVQDYYSTFKRMLALNDVQPKGLIRWPASAKPPRNVREAITSDDLNRILEWLDQRSYRETADLVVILRALGTRVQREVLNEGSIRISTRNGHLYVLITGKGGHQRALPCMDQEAATILRDKHRLISLRAVPYKTHLWRWNAGRRLLGIEGLTTFHSIRHKYATDLLGKTKNLRLVQEALGHSNPATTAIYTHIGQDELRQALTE